jgi:hypothetical protein
MACLLGQLDDYRSTREAVYGPLQTRDVEGMSV